MGQERKRERERKQERNTPKIGPTQSWLDYIRLDWAEQYTLIQFLELKDDNQI